VPPITYPTFPPGLETRLAATVLAATTHKTFFEDPSCPYSEELKGFLRKIVSETRVEKKERVRAEGNKDELDENADKFDLMLVEIESMMKEMDSIEDDLQDADTGDRVQYVKAKTALVEKWIGIKEKVYSVREIADFQTIVIELMDSVLDKDQRLLFIEKLRALRTTEKAAVRLEEVRG
jgi:hypothetical protein